MDKSVTISSVSLDKLKLPFNPNLDHWPGPTCGGQLPTRGGWRGEEVEEKSSFAQFSSVLCRFFFVDFFLPEFFSLLCYYWVTVVLFSPDTRGRLDHGRPTPCALRKQIVVQIIIYNRRKQLHHKNAPSKQCSVQSRVIEDFLSVYCCYLFTFRHWSNWWQVRCEPYVQMYRGARAVHNCVPKRILSPLLNTHSQLWWDRYHFVCTLAYTWL